MFKGLVVFPVFGIKFKNYVFDLIIKINLMRPTYLQFKPPESVSPDYLITEIDRFGNKTTFN